jgi:hypothetical protein
LNGWSGGLLAYQKKGEVFILELPHEKTFVPE